MFSLSTVNTLKVILLFLDIIAVKAFKLTKYTIVIITNL